MRSWVRGAGVRRVVSLIGASRHSALPILRARAETVGRPLIVRVLALTCGCTLIGAAVALLVEADLGLPPYDVLSSGVADLAGLSLGQAGWAVAGVLFVVAALLGKRPSAWGIVYIVGNGLAIDAVAELLNQPATTAGRVGFLLAGILVMAVGVNVVLYSGTTGGPFELLMRAGEDRGVSPTLIRYLLDVSVLVGGLAIGGAAGWGTVAYAFAMGLVLQVVSQAFSDHRVGRDARLDAKAATAHEDG